ncbi:hypothetical protein V1498_09785 [Peribacillus sp. SCS-26]
MADERLENLIIAGDDQQEGNHSILYNERLAKESKLKNDPRYAEYYQ